MKNPFLPLGIFLLVTACTGNDDPEPLIKKYDLAWDTEMKEGYPTAHGNVLESALVTDVDGGLFIAFRSSFSPNMVMARTDETGNIVDDNTSPSESPMAIRRNAEGGFYFASYLGMDGSYRIRNYNAAANLLSTSDLLISLPTFTRFYFVDEGVIRLRSDDFTVEMLDLSGGLGWKKTLVELGFAEFINLQVVGKNPDEFTLVGVDQNGIRLTHVDARTGSVLWKQGYAFVDRFEGLFFNYNLVWGDNGKIYFTGVKYIENKPQLFLTVLNSKGGLAHFRDVTPELEGFHPGALVPTSDGGAVVVLNSNLQIDPVNFRLLKFDSKGNPGWLGQFHQVSYDYLGTIIEKDDGEIVFTTRSGYMAGIKPSY